MECLHILGTQDVIEHWEREKAKVKPTIRPHIECWRCGRDTGVVNSPLLAIPIYGIFCDECRRTTNVH